jgi:hypothetical protein
MTLWKKSLTVLTVPDIYQCANGSHRFVSAAPSRILSLPSFFRYLPVFFFASD